MCPSSTSSEKREKIQCRDEEKVFLSDRKEGKEKNFFVFITVCLKNHFLLQVVEIFRYAMTTT